LRGPTRLSLGLFICGLASLLGSCQQVISFPAPSANKIEPSAMEAGQPAFTLTVTGSNFVPSSLVLWNGVVLQPTLFTNSNTLTAQVPASNIQNAGQAFVQVATPPPGGGTSPAPPSHGLQFTINPAPSPLPQILSLSPSGVTTGSGQFFLTVAGRNYVSQSIVTVNGNNRPTGFGNSTSLFASIQAADVANGGTVQIAVVNPQPNGGASNTFLLQVNNPVPSITSISPAVATAGSAGTSLTLTGTGFVPNSTVLFNGAPRAPLFGASIQLSISLTAADFLAGGIDQVKVVNPAPVGGTSNTLTFAVNPTATAGLPVLVDLAPDGTQANAGVCGPACAGVPTPTTAGPAMSSNGELVAFASTSTNLLSNPTSGSSDIFLRNTCFVPAGSSSCAQVTSRVNVTPGGSAANGPSSEPSLDSTGSHAAYTSTANNLITYATVPGGTRQIYWQPTCSTGTAAACGSGSNPAVLVSIDPLGSPGNGNSFSPAISPDGRYVAFVSLATNLVSGVAADGITPQVYLRDTCNGVTPLTMNPGCMPVTFLVSSPNGVIPGNGPSSHPSVANNGGFASFVSTATNLLAPSAPNPGGPSEIFEQTECQITTSGCIPTMILVSTQDGVTLADRPSIQPSMSADGRFVAFASTATNLIPGLGPIQQIYVRDTCASVPSGTACAPSIALASTADGTTPANAPSEEPNISPQCSTTGTPLGTTGCQLGEFVAFATKATNLGSNVTNGVENVYVRNTCEGVPTSSTTSCTPSLALASHAAGASPPAADGDSFMPAISGDGKVVSFISAATNLIQRDTNALDDIFLAATSF
jgi:hypothetical protein